jgi:hypothetical protein
MKQTSKLHRRRRLVIAPPPSQPGLHSAVLNVDADDEDVEWLWTETPDGRCVSGYQLVPRFKPPT